MNGYFIVAAFSVQWEMDDKPHLFEGVQKIVFSVQSLAWKFAYK